MRAISLWNPWAELVARGHKGYETRSWATAYRGELVIASSKTSLSPAQMSQLLDADPRFAAMLVRLGVLPEGPRHVAINAYREWPRGAALAAVTLDACYRVEDVRANLGAAELAFGDYTDRRYAWRLSNVRRLTAPVPMLGRQGLFRPSEAIAAAIAAAMPAESGRRCHPRWGSCNLPEGHVGRHSQEGPFKGVLDPNPPGEDEYGA